MFIFCPREKIYLAGVISHGKGCARCSIFLYPIIAIKNCTALPEYRTHTIFLLCDKKSCSYCTLLILQRWSFKSWRKKCSYNQFFRFFKRWLVELRATGYNIPYFILVSCYYNWGENSVLFYCNIVADPPHFSADLDPYPSLHFDADPDLSFHFHADMDPDPDPHQSNAILRPLVYRSFTNHSSILSLHVIIASVHGAQWDHYESSQLLNFYFNADPDPASHDYADPGPQHCIATRASCICFSGLESQECTWGFPIIWTSSTTSWTAGISFGKSIIA